MLDFALVYSMFQKVIGSADVRGQFAERYLRVQPGQKVLDLACGPGTIIPFLPDTSYLGTDRNPDYIQRAKRRFTHRAQFLCQDLFAPLPPDAIDCDIVIGFGIVHHLDDQQARRLFQLAFRLLKPGGRFVTLDGCYREGQSAIAYWLNRLDRGRHVRTAEQYSTLARAAFAEVRVFDYCGKLRVPVDHCVMVCEKPYP